MTVEESSENLAFSQRLQDALEFADKLIYQQTGKHLNDLEREVFIGSWQGQTYEKIYPLNPQYIEKDVGYKLWKKLSVVLEEKVTKKNLQGAIVRARQRQADLAIPLPSVAPTLASAQCRVFISHQLYEPDWALAQQLSLVLQQAGHQVAIAGKHRQSLHWPTAISQEIEQCDYLILLLSESALMSEMVIEELRQVRQLQESRQQARPVIVSVRLGDTSRLPLNPDLRNGLQRSHAWEWRSDRDTPVLFRELLALLAGQGSWQVTALDAEPDLSTGNPATLSTPASPIPTPLPVAEPEIPGGQVRLDSAFYIHRLPDELQCYREILQPGALIRIKAPRQMGKTSLMARILYHAREQGYRTVPLSFQHADTSTFNNLQQLLKWFCTRVTRKLKLPDRVDEHWSETYGSKDNCTAYFEECLLSTPQNPLVLGLDEVDRVFQYPQIADDFFGLLRAWYEDAGYGDGSSDLWQSLRLVVVHSTEVYIPLNVNQSPFNVGLSIELPEFSREQVTDLTQRHGLQWSAAQIQQLMDLIGGHPYLVRLALYHLAQRQSTLDEFLAIAPTEAGPYDDHLRRHLWNLQRYPELGLAYRQAVVSDVPVELDSIQAFKLHSMGLVQMQANRVLPRLNLYRQYFRDRLAVFSPSS